MEPEVTLLRLPATCSYPEPDQSSSPPKSQLLKFRFNIILPDTNNAENSSLLGCCTMSTGKQRRHFEGPLVVQVDPEHKEALCSGPV